MPDRILLIRLRQIGDVVFTTPAVRAIRERFPRAHVAYLVESAAAPIVTGNPHIDEVIVAPRSRGLAGLGEEAVLARRLRSSRYDLVVDFHGGPRASILAWLSGAPDRIGYDIPSRGWMYTRRIPRVRTPSGGHSVLNQWALLDALGIARPDRAFMPVEMPLDQEVAGRVQARLAGAGVRATDHVIVIHVSAGNPFRRWPIPSFAAVAAALASRGEGRRIVVTSGPSETEAANATILGARDLLAPENRERVLACGDFSLAELRALVERAALYIGGDSGPMHIASTSSVPMVSLYGPTLPQRSAPWRPAASLSATVEVTGLPCRPCDQRQCAPGDFRCLTWIQPQQVIDASEHLLSGAAVQ